MDAVFYMFLVLCWASGFFFLWRIPVLKEDDRHPLSPETVSVIIPARNEEANLGRLLQSFQHQSMQPGEIIVVDDHSSDGTADLAEAFGCRLIRSETVPTGWLGKPWACWQGARAASGTHLLFLDADVFLVPGGLPKILAAFSEERDLVSIQPYHRMEAYHEQLSAFFNIITLAGINAFTPFGSKIKPAGAFGPSLMCRRTDYFSLGGHERVRGDILENMALGKAFVRQGRRVACFGGNGSLEFRMYPEGMGSLWHGFGKAFALGANAVSIVSLVMIVCWVFGGVSLTRHLVQAVFAGDGAGILFFLALDAAYVGQIYWMLSRIGNFSRTIAVFFQVPLLFFIVTFFVSIAQTFVFRRARWKGRTVKPQKMT